MEYRGYAYDRHNVVIKTHLFETKICGKPSWVLVKEYPNGENLIYSISDSPSILDFLVK